MQIFIYLILISKVMTSIFLSHNSKDKSFVRTLAKHLGKEGIQTWVDEAEIKIGDSLIEKISDGIINMNFLGAILSPNSLGSNWVKKEIEMAMNMEINGNMIKVLPILYKECEIPPFLVGKKYADFTDSENFLKELDNLINVITGHSASNPVKKIENKEVKDIDHFDKIKFVFQFARSSNGLDMYSTKKAIKFAEDWAEKYSISVIKKIIHCFHFARDPNGLDKYSANQAMNFALEMSQKYSAKELSKLIEIFQFARDPNGLEIYNPNKAWEYAKEKIKN